MFLFCILTFICSLTLLIVVIQFKNKIKHFVQQEHLSALLTMQINNKSLPSKGITEL